MKKRIISINISLSYMYVHVFAVDLFLRNTAEIIFSHKNMKSGGLWLFQKISGPRARDVGCGFGMDFKFSDLGSG